MGNLEDITLRALRLLREADVILAEDTRRTGILLRHHGIRAKKLLSYHKFNERRRIAEVLDLLRSEAVVAVVGDAGTPLLADPGERLVEAAAKGGLSVVALPGAQALLPALTASGLPVTPFHFEGFLPRRPRGRSGRLSELASLPATIVVYESPERLVDTLEAARREMGDRRAVVAREISKLHETYHRGTLGSLLAEFEGAPPKGECVLIIEGLPAGVAGEEEKRREMSQWVKRKILAGESPARIRKEASAAGYSKNAAYRLAIGQQTDGKEGPKE